MGLTRNTSEGVGSRTGKCQFLEVGLGDQRIDLRLLGEARAGHLQIDPGRYQPGAPRQWLSCVAQHRYERQSEAATGAVAADRYLGGSDPLIEEKAIGRARILERRWEWVLGREAIGNRERARPGRATRFSHHAAVAHDGA